MGHPPKGCYTSKEHGVPCEHIVVDKTAQDRCGHALQMPVTHISTTCAGPSCSRNRLWPWETSRESSSEASNERENPQLRDMWWAVPFCRRGRRAHGPWGTGLHSLEDPNATALPRPHPPFHIPSAACLPSHSTPPAPAAARGSPRIASLPSAAPAPRWQRRRASAAGPAASVAGQRQGPAAVARRPGAEGRRRRWPARTWGCAAGPAAAGRAAGIVGCGQAHGRRC